MFTCYFFIYVALAFYKLCIDRSMILLLFRFQMNGRNGVAGAFWSGNSSISSSKTCLRAKCGDSLNKKNALARQL